MVINVEDDNSFSIPFAFSILLLYSSLFAYRIAETKPGSV